MKKSAIILAAIMLLSSFEPVVATEKPTTENKKINWLLENDFVAGRGKTKDLKLEDTITRAEFTRMILVIKGEENLAKDSTSKVDFKDVPNTHWAEKFIVYAKQKGYISGYPDGNFRPEGEITYEEMISILSRIHPNYRKIEAKSTNWAEGFINFAKDNGILDDISIDGSYKSPAIREKTFEMTYNFIKFVENQTKSEKVSKIKEEKDVKRENSTWNGFYPYWLGYGFRPIVEEKPEVKPNPDVKPVPDKHEEPGTPEKENPSEPGTQPETPGEENPTEPGKENPSEPGTEPENPTEPGKENPSDPGTEPESPSEPETPKEFDKTKIDKIEIVSQPSKREYTEGEKLDLTGIKLKLTDTQGKDKGIGLEHFNEYGIATDPANETGLSVNENGTTIKIKLNGVEKVETAPLKVKAKVFDPDHVEKMVVKEQPTNLSYTEGEKLNLAGLEVTLTDNQGLTKDVAFADFEANGITAEPANDTELKLADNGSKVKLTKGNLTAETEALTVSAKVFDPAHVEKMVVKTQPTNLIYTEGEKLNLAGLEVTLTDNQGLTKDVAFADFEANGIEAAPANETALTVAANNGRAVELTKGSLTAQTNQLTVKAKVFDPDHVEKMVVKTQPTNLSYTEGEKLNLAGLEVTLTDNQGLTKDVAFADFGDNGITAEPANDTALTVDDHNGKTVKLTKESLKAETEALTVKAKVFDPDHVEKMVVKTQPTNLTYTEGEKLNLAGLEVTLTDNQGLTKNVAFKDFAANGITTEPKNNKQLTESENNTKIKIKRGDKEAITGNISLTLKVISKADFEKENKIKTSIKNSLVEVYKSLGYIKLGIDNLHNKYYLLFTKESNKIEIEKDNLKTSILNTIKNNKIKSYTIGETNRELLDGENYKSDETILGFIREDILKLAGLEGNPSATDTQILEKLEVTKPNSNIKLVVGDDINLDYEIIFLSQMTEDKVNQIEADFIEHMKETSLAVQKEDKGFQVSYKDKEYKVLIKPAYKFYDMQELAGKCGYDRVLINFFTGENLDTAKSLKNLKSLKIYNKNRYDRISNVVMDSLELQTLLVGKEDFRERTKIYHETFKKPNRGIFAEDLAPGTIILEYFYTDESSKTGSIITRNIFYKIIN